MAASTTKKVVLRRFDREPLAGFVNPYSFLSNMGVELMSVEGTVQVVPYGDVKSVRFVRDFDSITEPERKVFQNRPKMEGLWIRVALRDREVMEGILTNDLLQISIYGFTFTPPEPYSNQQKVFIPRAAIDSIQVLGVVGSPLKPKAPKARPVTVDQPGLFD